MLAPLLRAVATHETVQLAEVWRLFQSCSRSPRSISAIISISGVLMGRAIPPCSPRRMTSPVSQQNASTSLPGSPELRPHPRTQPSATPNRSQITGSKFPPVRACLTNRFREVQTPFGTD